VLTNTKMTTFITRGSFGKIYSEQDNIIKKVKLVTRSSKTNQPHIEYSTIREIAFLNTFNHPNIIKMKEVKKPSEKKNIKIVLENGGIPLGQWGKKTADNFKHLPWITYQLLKALYYLQVNGIVHSDIKPSNIVVDVEYNAKLIDFGGCIFRATKDSVALCSTDCFMAPEQRIYFAKQNNKKLETHPKNDVFSLAMTIFSVYFGSFPKDKPTIKTKHSCFNVLKAFRKEVKDLTNFTDIKFLDMLMSCLIIDMNKRPSAHDVLQHECFKVFSSKEEKISYEPFLYAYIKHTNEKIENICDEFKCSQLSEYASFLYTYLLKNKNVKEFLETNIKFKDFVDHFCIDISIILFDDLFDSNLLDFECYDCYSDVRYDMIEAILPLIDFDIYKPFV